MSSSNETAPSPDSPSPPTAPPPPKSSDGNGSDSSSPPTPAVSSPPESSPSPPPPSDSASPPAASSPPPPSSDDSSSSAPPPSSNSSGSSPPNFVSPPPPPQSSSKASPPPPTAKALSPPPPPAHRTSPSSSTPSSSSSSSTSSSSSSSSNLPMIVGVSVGLGVLLIAFIAICIACSVRKKKKKRDEMHYYMDHSHGHKVGHDYYASSQHPNWHNGNPTSNHLGKLNPQSGIMGSPGGGGWPPPPPPPPMMNSSDMSSGYSGPRHHPPLPPPSPGLALGFNSSTFTYDELAIATGGFAQANMLGQGGFGYVHKGVLPNGKEVAVKSLKSGSGQGEREFQAEVEIISRVHHRHLVSLVGYCIAGGQRMLVYEFVPNKTLEYHLYRDDPVMDWATRLRIAVGSAKGLAYLHEDCHPRIIHRDIKAANILLDNNFEAMVADFGLAKLSSDNYTHVSTRVMGTFGYLAPEYASSGKLTEKSDVFSFGVMLLEIITGRRPVDIHNVMEDSLVDWARPLLTQALDDGNYDELVDPSLENNFNPHEMARMVSCASASIRHSAKKRPKMSQIVRALDGDVSLDDLNEGVRPGHSSVFGTNSSSDYDASSYNADMKRFRKVALSSQDFGSSDYGNSSGESREMGRSPNKT